MTICNFLALHSVAVKINKEMRLKQMRAKEYRSRVQKELEDASYQAYLGT